MARYQSAAAGLCYTSDLSPTNSSKSLIDQTDILNIFLSLPNDQHHLQKRATYPFKRPR